MKTFKDLINSHIADPNYTTVLNGDVPSFDPICRAYNMIWGLFTNTHMSNVNGDYVVTGSMFMTGHQDVIDDWLNGLDFCNSTIIWKMVEDITGLTGVINLNTFMSHLNYCGEPAIINGDSVYVFKKCEKPEETKD